MPEFMLSGPLTEADIETFEPHLSDTQANILKSHGRNSAIYAFLTFGEDLRAAASALSQFSSKVTSAYHQYVESMQTKDSPNPVITVGLTRAGLDKLGQLNGRFPFRQFREVSEQLGVTPSGEWLPPFNAPVDALISIASDACMDEQRSAVEALFQPPIAIIQWQSGHVERDDKGRVREHFGVVDGISQPPALPILLLTTEGAPRATSHGSYLVFLKLRQEVETFETEIAKLAELIGPPTSVDRKEYAAALVMGRYRDGTSLATNETPLNEDRASNTFTYEGDVTGAKCPLASHARKMNPRRSGVGNEHVIMRRSTLYKGSENDRGVLFQCFQRDIGNRFEFLWLSWANAIDHPEPSTGADPLIGKGDAAQRWPRSYNSSERVECLMHRFVTLLGGEYFYVPSLSFLRNLS